MSRDLERLEPVTREMARRLIGAAAICGMELYIVHTYRSAAEQLVLYRQGRNEQGEVVDRSQVVTNAKPWYSWHNYGRAIDVAFEDLLGKPTWVELRPGDWQLLGQLGERIGFEWGGRTGVGTKGDLGHFQFRDGSTLEEARAAHGH